jgi:hypothetical protein
MQDIQINDNPNLFFVNLTATQILLQENTSYTGKLSIWSNGPEVQIRIILTAECHVQAQLDFPHLTAHPMGTDTPHTIPLPYFSREAQ